MSSGTPVRRPGTLIIPNTTAVEVTAPLAAPGSRAVTPGRSNLAVHGRNIDTPDTDTKDEEILWDEMFDVETAGVNFSNTVTPTTGG